MMSNFKSANFAETRQKLSEMRLSEDSDLQKPWATFKIQLFTQ